MNDEYNSKDDDIKEEKSISNVGSSSFDEKDKQGIIEELYRCKARVDDFVSSVEGKNGQDAIAGRKFLKDVYKSLTAVINTTNAFTKKNGEETQKILYREVKGFTYLMVNERTIHRRYYRTLVYSYWHMLELFLGLARNGHGANVLKDALAGLNTQEKEEEVVEGAFGRLKKMNI